MLINRLMPATNNTYMNYFFRILLCAGCITTAIQAAPYSGRVFVDKNNNSRFDKGEKALAGVAVSDGLHVVKTASDGSFTLPGHARERFIFITTPSGYKTDNRHYVPISPAVSSYDFGLRPYQGRIGKDGSHRYLHISDTEIFNTENQEDWVKNLRAYAALEKAAFIIHTGDICYEKGLTEHIGLMNTAGMDCPVFYAIGNHDLVKGERGEALFERIYGPVYYSFDAGSVHYIVTPMAGGDHAPGYSVAEVATWMKNDLAQVPEGKPVIVFNHDLLTYGNTFRYGEGASAVDLNAFNLKGWMYGHWHINYMRKQGPVTTVSTATLDKGGIDHSTSAFRVLKVDKNGDFTSELRYTYRQPAVCISAPAGGQAAVTASGTVPLVVNAYASASPVKKVVYTCVAGGKRLFTGKPLQPATDWCWRAEVPLSAKQEGQPVSLKVKAFFRNGEEVESETSFTYRARQTEIRLGTDWANLGGNPAHTGKSDANLAVPLQLAWTTNVGANLFMTSPVISEGKIYVASVDENLKGEAAVFALNAADGRVVWKYPVRNSVKNSIALDGGKVFAQDAEGYVYALDGATGALRWEKKLEVNGLPALIDGLVASGGTVYAGTGKGLCALEGETGALKWQNKGWNQGEGTTSTLSLGAGMLIGSAQWSGLYGHDASTGECKWKAEANGLRNRGASAAVHGSLLYLVSDKSFFILDAASGRVVVRRALPMNVDVTSTPLLTDGEIIFGTATEGLVALDRETLEPKWHFRTEDALIYTVPYSRQPASTVETSPVLAGKIVYFGASDGTIYGVSADEGKLVWKHSAGAPVFGSVAVSGNALVATDFGGNVYAFASGEPEKKKE